MIIRAERCLTAGISRSTVVDLWIQSGRRGRLVYHRVTYTSKKSISFRIGRLSISRNRLFCLRNGKGVNLPPCQANPSKLKQFPHTPPPPHPQLSQKVSHIR